MSSPKVGGRGRAEGFLLRGYHLIVYIIIGKGGVGYKSLFLRFFVILFENYFNSSLSGLDSTTTGRRGGGWERGCLSPPLKVTLLK